MDFEIFIHQVETWSKKTISFKEIITTKNLNNSYIIIVKSYHSKNICKAN